MVAGPGDLARLSKDQIVMKSVFTFLLAIVLSIPTTLLGGVVLSDFWGWFIQPTFGGPALSTLAAVGLMLTVSIFKIGIKGVEMDGFEDAEIAKAVATSFGYALVYLLIWGVGALWSLFI